MNNNIIEELEKRARNRSLHRTLRDESDPFNLPAEIFRKMYRLDVEGARQIFGVIEEHNNLRNERNHGIPPVVKFLSTLHFLAHGSYQKSVGKDFHVALSQTSVSRCLHNVIGGIIETMHHKISFPTDENQKIEIKARFFERFNMPGILGCIDCTHVAIFPPPAGVYGPRNIFINRKGFFSLNCQIICDSDLNIIGINSQFPGSVHDSAIWQMSRVRNHLLENFRNGDRHSWLLGDSGYPLQPFLLTPIPGAEANTPEGRYTRQHCLVRNSVERCIGLLKAYFRCLNTDRVLHYDPVFASQIILACAILHNILRERNLHIDDELEENVAEVIIDDDMDPLDIDNNLLDLGNQIRRNLIDQLF